MSFSVTVSRRGTAAVVTIDNPPVNALAAGVAEAVADAVEAANADREVSSIVIMGAGKTFVAGAEIRELALVAAGQLPPITLSAAFNRIEASAKPVIMAIHGSALGGGLELAMAGHYRVAAVAAKVGQPEVNLGLIPGAGGTQRLPRLCGIAKALDLCVTGRAISAAEALDAGVIDRVVDGDLLEGAIEFGKGVSEPRRTRDMAMPEPDAEAVEAARKDATKRMRLQAAPLAAIDAIEPAAGQGTGV